MPVTPDTLWLRILGKGKTQQQAIDELLTFTPEHPQRQRTLELLLTWGITIENTDDFTQSEQDIIIKLRALYQENIQAAEEKEHTMNGVPHWKLFCLHVLAVLIQN